MIYGKTIFLDAFDNVWFSVIYYLRAENDGYKIVLEKDKGQGAFREVVVSDISFQYDEEAENMLKYLVEHHVTPCTLNDVLSDSCVAA